MSKDICYADATELAEGIRTRTLSPMEVPRAHLDRIEAVNPKINALVTLADDALEQAQEAGALFTSPLWTSTSALCFAALKVKQWIPISNR